MAIYMNIAGITGDAVEATHKGWIDVTGMSSPLVRKTPDGAFGADAVAKGFLVFGNVELTRRVDTASVALARQAAVGDVYDSIRLHVTMPSGGGEKTVVEYDLQKAILASHAMHFTAVGGGGQEMMENLSVNFARVTWTYKKYKDGKADGVVTGWYDRTTSTGG